MDWRFPVVALEDDLRDAAQDFAFYGPTCDDADYMQGPFALPGDIQAGDYVEIGMLGAYGTAMKTGFNGFGNAAQVLVAEETARLPETITVEVVQDVTSIIRDRLVMLVQNGVIGLVLVGISGLQLAGIDLNVSVNQLVWTGIVQGLGCGLMWVPLSVVTPVKSVARMVAAEAVPRVARRTRLGAASRFNMRENCPQCCGGVKFRWLECLKFGVFFG